MSSGVIGIIIWAQIQRGSKTRWGKFPVSLHFDERLRYGMFVFIIEGILYVWRFSFVIMVVSWSHGSRHLEKNSYFLNYDDLKCMQLWWYLRPIMQNRCFQSVNILMTSNWWWCHPRDVVQTVVLCFSTTISMSGRGYILPLIPLEKFRKNFPRGSAQNLGG